MIALYVEYGERGILHPFFHDRRTLMYPKRVTAKKGDICIIIYPSIYDAPIEYGECIRFYKEAPNGNSLLNEYTISINKKEIEAEEMNLFDKDARYGREWACLNVAIKNIDSYIDSYIEHLLKTIPRDPWYMKNNTLSQAQLAT